jgi:hypothetical protein
MSFLFGGSGQTPTAASTEESAVGARPQTSPAAPSAMQPTAIPSTQTPSTYSATPAAPQKNPAPSIPNAQGQGSMVSNWLSMLKLQGNQGSGQLPQTPQGPKVNAAPGAQRPMMQPGQGDYLAQLLQRY